MKINNDCTATLLKWNELHEWDQAVLNEGDTFVPFSQGYYALTQFKPCEGIDGWDSHFVLTEWDGILIKVLDNDTVRVAHYSTLGL